ncbi:MAG: lactonase family protein [Chitinophagaceae bacterium]|nr:lactonase family protein [Rubrivivax sp.]
MRYAVYVSNADSGDLAVLHLDADSGALVEFQRVEVGPMPMPLALGPNARCLYVAQRGEPWRVVSFRIDAANGRLTPIGAAPLPHSMAYIATDRGGRHLLSASYGGDLIAVGPIDPQGVAGAVQQVLQTPPNAHAIVAAPSNRHVLATSLGGGVLLQYRFDAHSGRLTPNLPLIHAPHGGASPRHLRFSADARFVYLLNELDATIDVLAFDDEQGLLNTLQTISTLSPGFAGQPWAADLHLTPDGRILYASERRSSLLTAFGVDRQHGSLTLLGHWPTQAQPRAFSITPDGRHLLVAGQLSGRLGVHAIDAADATLRPRGEIEVGLQPSGVEVVAIEG